MIGFKDFARLRVFKQIRLMKNAKFIIVNRDGADTEIDLDELAAIDTLTAAEIALLQAIDATAAEINNVADVSARVQELTASGAVTAGIQSLELNHATVAIAATVADLANHPGFFIVKNTSASGTAGHNVVASAGTWDGTNDTITTNAPNDAILVYIDSAGNGTVIENVGSVSLS